MIVGTVQLPRMGRPFQQPECRAVFCDQSVRDPVDHRSIGGERGVEARRHLGDQRLHHAREDVVLAGKVLVQRRLGDPGLAGDGFHRDGSQPVRQAKAARGGEDALLAVPRATACLDDYTI